MAQVDVADIHPLGARATYGFVLNNQGARDAWNFSVDGTRTWSFYVDNGDGTITDNRTALMWEKLYNDNSVRHDYNNVAYLWEGAFKKVDDLNAENFAGHSDWRLPNIRELDSIVVFDNPGLVVDPVFGNVGTLEICLPCSLNPSLRRSESGRRGRS